MKMATHVASSGLNGNGQLHLPLPASRKAFLRSLQPRVGVIEDEINRVQLRLAAIEARPAPNASDPSIEARLELVKGIVEMLLHTGRRRPRRQAGNTQNAH